MEHYLFYTLAEGIMISVRSLQRSEGDVSDPISIYILDQHHWTVRPILRKLVSQF